MKFLFIALVLSFASSAFAIPNQKLVEACTKKATQKILDRSTGGCSIDLEDLKVDAIDNRLFNPSKYIWFSAPETCHQDVSLIKVMVQYDTFSKTCI